MLASGEPTASMANALKLMNVLNDYEDYANEAAMEVALYDVFRASGLPRFSKVTFRDSQTANDGGMTYVVEQDVALLSVSLEVKHWLGATGTDPLRQNIGYFIKSWADVLAARSTLQRRPMLLVAVAGPFVFVQGAVLAGNKVCVAPLADPLNLQVTFDGGHEARMLRAARLLTAVTAFHTAVSSKATETQLAASSALPHDCGSVDGSQLTHVRVFGTDRRWPMFTATTNTGAEVLVKFVLRYGRAQHYALASLGVAPALFAHDELPGGWLRIIMEHVRDAVPWDNSVPPCMRLQLRDAMQKFADDGYVHGDLRTSNVLYSAKKGPVVVDFDWAGAAGAVCYPLDVRPELYPGVSVAGGGVIEAAHDASMLDALPE